MTTKTLSIVSLIVELISTVLLYFMAYKMYTAQCIQGWAFWLWLLVPLLLLLYMISMVMIDVKTKNKTIVGILGILGIILFVAAFIFKIWFFIKIWGCADINIYLKLLFVILIIVNAIINYFNKDN